MIRKITTIALGLLAVSALLLTIAPSQNAQAQTCSGEYDNCIAYPAGGFKAQSTPVPTASPGPTSAAVVSADNVAATGSTSGSGSGGATIAFTGAESRVLGYAGAGLIGLGAVALVVARRQTDTDLN